MLIRYPGSKDKHLSLLTPYLTAATVNNRSVYEPFAGTAAVTFSLLKDSKIDYYHINDIDAGIAALWQTVKKEPQKLVNKVKTYVPTVEDFYEFKKNAGGTVFEKAFRKLVLHQISFSGLGGMAGGPMGGRKQLSKYGVGCRWYPNKLVKGIMECSRLLNSVEGVITSTSWEDTVDAAVANAGFIYLDPPYFVKGGELYVNGDIDHLLLAEKLKSSHSFVLSYDDAVEVRNLYGWAEVEALDVRSHLHHKMITDLVIVPKSL